MPPKRSAKAKSASGSKKEQAPPRVTRCPPDFQWQARPPLVEATDKNDLDRVKRLLNKGEDPNVAIHHAIGRGKLLIAQALLEAGADLSSPVHSGDYWVPPPPAPPKPEKKAKKAKSKKKKK